MHGQKVGTLLEISEMLQSKLPSMKETKKFINFYYICYTSNVSLNKIFDPQINQM